MISPAKTQAGASDAARRPLAGVRILDFGQIILLPFATRWLAWMGAEIILVESRARPVQRVTPPFAFGRSGLNTGARFNSLNYNKASCTLNLKSAEAVALIKGLVTRCDAVVENFSAGAIDRLGLGYEVLSKEKPGLVYLSASAFGRTGEWRDYIGFHSAVNAFSGLAQITGYEGGPPRMLGAVLPDTIGGMYITYALMLALYDQRRTGQGCFVDFSMLEGLLSVMPQPIMDYTLNGREWNRGGNRDAAKAPHGIYRCQPDDQWVAISVSSQAEWVALCEVTGRRDWPADLRFIDEPSRLAHRVELDAAVETWTVHQTAVNATRLLQAAGIAAGPASNVGEVLNDPHLLARKFVVEVDHPEAGIRKNVGLPWKIGEVPDTEYRHAPLIGEHNRYVFGQILGLSDDEIRALTDKGVIE